jgi:hypothetical protein
MKRTNAELQQHETSKDPTTDQDKRQFIGNLAYTVSLVGMGQLSETAKSLAEKRFQAVLESTLGGAQNVVACYLAYLNAADPAIDWIATDEAYLAGEYMVAQHVAEKAGLDGLEQSNGAHFEFRLIPS